MGVTCQILLDKKPEGIHRAGQTVTGSVKYAVDKQTAYKAVTLSLLGTGNCSWRETDSNKKSTTYSGSEEYITIHVDLLQKVQESGLLDTGTVYEYPFEFHLPENLPSSFKNHTCTIAYRIQLKFEKPEFFSINKVFSTEIPVYGYVEPTVEGPIIFGLEKTLMKLFATQKPVINLKAEITKTCLTPGENAHLAVVLTNDSHIVPSVKTYLFCHIKYTANCGRTNSSYLRVKDCSSDRAEVPEQGVAKLSQTIPTSPSLYSITSKVMTIEYRLKVTVRLPMPHVNAFVEYPLVIGERRGRVSEEGVEALGEKGELSAGFVEPRENTDDPPSYWEVMCEDKVIDKE